MEKTDTLTDLLHDFDRLKVMAMLQDLNTVLEEVKFRKDNGEFRHIFKSFKFFRCYFTYRINRLRNIFIFVLKSHIRLFNRNIHLFFSCLKCLIRKLIAIRPHFVINDYWTKHSLFHINNCRFSLFRLLFYVLLILDHITVRKSINPLKLLNDLIEAH